MRILCCRINSWRWFKVELTLCIDSKHSTSSILKDWKLKRPPAWFHIWSRCDGPLAWASINERQYEREENSLVSDGKIDPHLDREPSVREKGMRAQPVFNAKTPLAHSNRNTTSPFHSGWPFRLNPFNPTKNLLSQQTFEFCLSVTKKGWNANQSVSIYSFTPPPSPRVSQSPICQTCK